jgi:hypothetical protein
MRVTLAALFATLAIGNVGLAESLLKHEAREIIVQIDHLQRTAQFVPPEIPDAIPFQLHSALENAMRKAQALVALCQPIRLCAEKIEAGDESDETAGVLFKLMLKFQLANKEFDAATDEMKRRLPK